MIKTHFQEDHPDVAKDCEAFSILQPDAHNMTKSASAAISRDIINQHKPDKDHVAVHLVAMGADERYGPNRNHDGFPSEALKKFHPTFVTHGNLFREHANKDPKKRIGIVKYAAYNDPMDRVELIVWMDKKAAADECERARAGKELSFSMSSRMPHDTCSICKNKARHQSLYCNHLKYDLGRYLPGMRKYAYAINDTNLRFFDISAVKNRADRTAAHLRYHFGNDLEKAASFSMGGADLSAALGMTDDLFVPFDAWDAVELRKMAAAKGSYSAVALQPLSDAQLNSMRDHDLRHVLGELTKRACLIDFLSFASLVADKSPSELIKNAGFMVTLTKSIGNDMLGDMHDSGGCDCGDAGIMVEPDMRGADASPCGDSIDKLMSDVEKNLGLSKQAQADRLLTGGPVLSGHASPVYTDETPVFDGIADAYKWYVAKSASLIANTDRVSYADFSCVLSATNRTLVGKSVDTP